MKEFRNAGKHRVCDISEDRRLVVIEKKGYVTRITANPDGTLSLKNLTKTA